METPLEIRFHNIVASDAIENQIHEHADRLARLHPHMTGMRIRVELPHQHQHSGNICEVHIEMALPGYKLAITHAPHHPEERYARPNLETSLRDAFSVAERKLKEEVDRRGPKSRGRKASALSELDARRSETKPG